ncbi:MAG: hypothetical protein HY269_04725 [Deltaproteobacteria bacterium]|nr:hypothetical protein [Deltaproteobacteria bacterium]
MSGDLVSFAAHGHKAPSTLARDRWRVWLGPAIAVRTWIPVPTANSSADVVCTEKVIRFDSGTESASVGFNGRADPPIARCPYVAVDVKGAATLTYADIYSREGRHVWAPPGRFAYKFAKGDGDDPYSLILKEAEQEGANWKPLKAGMFSCNAARFKEVAEAYKALIREFRFH